MRSLNRFLCISILLCVCWPSSASAADTDAFRHALIIGVAVYRDDEVPPLFGVPNDMDSAREIATAMGIPASNITELFNEKASKVNILAELRNLAKRNTDGSRILIYFSGHGTRWRDAKAGGCVEGLLTWDRQVIVNREFAQLARPLGLKADKLIIMFDACHSGGVAGLARNTRSLAGDTLTPKFFIRADAAGNACSKPSNVRTRSLIGSADDGVEALPENVVHIMSARSDEVSFDEPSRGGLATQAIKRCMLGTAQDTDGSGAVSLDEIEQCAQGFIRDKVAKFPDLLPHHVDITGLRNLVPVAVAAQNSVQQSLAQTTSPQQAPTKPSAEAVRLEKERLAREQREAAERQRQEEQQLAAQRAEQLKREQQRLARERAEAEAEKARLERERSEAEKQRLAAERAEAEQQRLAALRAEQARLEQERLVQEGARVEAERARLERERAEAEKQRLERARIAAEKQRLAAARAEAEKQRLAAERAEAARREQEQLAELAAQAAAAQAAVQAATPAVELGPLAALKDLYAQRDVRRSVKVALPRPSLRIDRDPFEMTVTSSQAGHVYVLLLGSDETSFYLLFPNGLDQNNRIEANTPMKLPRPHWAVNAAGPAGTDQLLVLVTETPRKLKVLPGGAINANTPFILTPATLAGRRQLVDFIIGAGVSGSARYGATWVTVKEVP